MSTRRASSTIPTSTPPNLPSAVHPWFLTDDLISVEEFDKIKGQTDRAAVVGKMVRLGIPGTSGNLNTILKKLRTYLEKPPVPPPGVDAISHPTPSATRAKRPRHQGRQETRFSGVDDGSRDAGKGDQERAESSRSQLSVQQSLTLSSDILMASMKNMTERLAVCARYTMGEEYRRGSGVAEFSKESIVGRS